MAVHPLMFLGGTAVVILGVAVALGTNHPPEPSSPTASASATSAPTLGGDASAPVEIKADASTCIKVDNLTVEPYTGEVSGYAHNSCPRPISSVELDLQLLLSHGDIADTATAFSSNVSPNQGFDIHQYVRRFDPDQGMSIKLVKVSES